MEVQKTVKKRPKNHIPLLNNAGYITRRQERAVLRYYLDYNNDEDFARGLLILFLPFRDELKDIHEKNVNDLYSENKETIQARRNIFEKHKVMTDIIYSLYKEVDDTSKDEEDVGNDEMFEVEETTLVEDVDKFEKWVKEQAHKTLKQSKDLTSLVEMRDLRGRIITLNEQQRMIFDDFCERMILDDDGCFYLYIAGEAGTGKSYLVS